MRITRIRVRAWKGVNASFDCDHVTAFLGPNGTGKTTAVSAVAYALTGRWPGIGDKYPALMALTEPSVPTDVEIETDDGVVVHRGYTAAHKASVWIQEGGDRVHGSKAEDRIGRLFGDVSFFADALEPERAIWRLSPEKFQTWVFGLCGAAAAWTPQRLTETVGDYGHDWNPALHRDPSICLAMNLAAVGESLLAAQRITRESEITAQTITSLREVTDEELEKARADHVAAVQDLARLQAALADPKPVEPAEPPVVRSHLDALRDELMAAEAELGAAENVAKAIHDAKLAAEEHLRLVSLARSRCAEGGSCPVCASKPEDGAWLDKAFTAATAMLQQSSDAVRNKAPELVRLCQERDAAAKQLQGLQRLWDHYDAQWANYQQALDAWRARGVGSEEEVSAVQVRSAQIKVKVAADVLAVTESAWTKWREVALHKDAVERSRAREAQLKALRTRLREVRTEMLRDATEPLQRSLASVAALAPQNGEFTVRTTDEFVQVGLMRGDRFIPYAAMSGAERLRATIALYAARRMLRPEPWSALFVDALEQVYAAEDRATILATLAAVTVLDNVFVAGACHDTFNVPGVRCHVTAS